MNRGILAFSVCVTLLFSISCAQNQSTTPVAKVNDPVISSTPPFQTKEPERYSAIRTITTVSATGQTEVTQNRIARDGEQRRDEREVDGMRVVYLELKEGSFVLLPEQKQFADLSESAPEAGREDDPETLADLMLHSDPKASTYQRIGTETIRGRNTQKYRVVVNTSSDANVSVSETVLWIDDALQMPIKSELKSSSGALSTSELSEISLEVDQSLFLLPKDYEKIPFAELLKRLKLD